MGLDRNIAQTTTHGTTQGLFQQPHSHLFLPDIQNPDINGDCKVNLPHFSLILNSWLECNLDPPFVCWEQWIIWNDPRSCCSAWLSRFYRDCKGNLVAEDSGLYSISHSVAACGTRWWPCRRISCIDLPSRPSTNGTCRIPPQPSSAYRLYIASVWTRRRHGGVLHTFGTSSHAPYLLLGIIRGRVHVRILYTSSSVRLYGVAFCQNPSQLSTACICYIASSLTSPDLGTATYLEFSFSSFFLPVLTTKSPHLQAKSLPDPTCL
jgi:hypothetical protein